MVHKWGCCLRGSVCTKGYSSVYCTGARSRVVVVVVVLVAPIRRDTAPVFGALGAGQSAFAWGRSPGVRSGWAVRGGCAAAGGGYARTARGHVWPANGRLNGRLGLRQARPGQARAKPGSRAAHGAWRTPSAVTRASEGVTQRGWLESGNEGARPGPGPVQRSGSAQRSAAQQGERKRGPVRTGLNSAVAVSFRQRTRLGVAPAVSTVRGDSCATGWPGKGCNRA